MIAVKDYVKRNDPLEKASRSKAKETNKPQSLSVTENVESETPSVTGNRKPLSQKLKHEVYLKYSGKCADEKCGKRCNATRDLHIHHIKPVSEGGEDTIDNLILLCGNHHRLIHK
jgi:predicted restriction endonuclease